VKIGFVLGTADRPEEGPGSAPRWERLARTARWAEAAGFASVWVYDHLLYRGRSGSGTRGIWEAGTILAALAAITERVELGPLVACTLFRSPAFLAKIAHTLDEVSGGRLVLGVGACSGDDELAAFGFPRDHRVARFAEALTVLVPLLREGRAHHEGRFQRVDRCEILPRGPRPGGPPLLVGAVGPRMMRLAARWADGWNGGYFGAPETADAARSALLQACEEVGRDPATLERTGVVAVHDPDRAPTPTGIGVAPLVGEPPALAEAFAGYAAAGFSHLMIQAFPPDRATGERVAAARHLFDEM